MQTRRRYALVALLLLLGAAPTVTAQPADAEVRIPFPKFAPRPSAVTLYCRPMLSSGIRGNDEFGSESAHIGARIDKAAAGADRSVKVAFSGTALLIASAVPHSDTSTKESSAYGAAFSYRVLSDDPGNFVALRDRTKEVGSLTIISMNRETGTMMMTDTYASLPDRGHPYTAATFYVCGPTLP